MDEMFLSVSRTMLMAILKYYQSSILTAKTVGKLLQEEVSALAHTGWAFSHLYKL
jgi:hypothetical protein